MCPNNVSFYVVDVDVDVTHFNALLTVYVENDHKFAPLELVEEMRLKEVNPNLVSQMHLKIYIGLLYWRDASYNTH